jgi:probable F420-dependent oxidoreductase
MDFGIGYFPTHDAVGPGEIARMVEERGFESLFFAEHTHIPASRETPYMPGVELPRKYWHTYDLFVALTAAAAATNRLRIGSGVCLVIERDPIITAKEVASLDHLSGGRFEFGVGAGWNREEMRNHGTDPRTRMRLLKERVEAMQAIWTESEASYEGEFVSFERIWSWPKPVQRPYPPVLVGGDGPTVLDRVLDFGDVWIPNYDGPETLQRAAELRERADRPIGFQVMSAPTDARQLDALAEAGCERACHWIPSGNRSVVEAALVEWERAIAEFTGEA